MQKKHIIVGLLITFIFVSYTGIGQAAPKQNDPEEYLSIKLKEKGVILGVKEPENWMGDLVRAGSYYADAMFYQDEKSFKKGAALIKVIVYEKRDENTIADLGYDTEQFKAENKKAKVENLSISHSEYTAFACLNYIKKEKYEYVCYLNLGREFKVGVLVTMRTLKQKANVVEMQIYDEIIRSIHLSQIEDLSTNPANSPARK